MIGNFFHLPKNRKFNFPFRYYDPAKDEMDERESRMKKELGIQEKKETNANFRPNIHGQFRQAMGSASKTAADAKSRSNSRLIMLIVILALAVFLFLKF